MGFKIEKNINVDPSKSPNTVAFKISSPKNTHTMHEFNFLNFASCVRLDLTHGSREILQSLPIVQIRCLQASRYYTALGCVPPNSIGYQYQIRGHVQFGPLFKGISQWHATPRTTRIMITLGQPFNLKSSSVHPVIRPSSHHRYKHTGTYAHTETKCKERQMATSHEQTDSATASKARRQTCKTVTFLGTLNLAPFLWVCTFIYVCIYICTYTYVHIFLVTRPRTNQNRICAYTCIRILYMWDSMPPNFNALPHCVWADHTMEQCVHAYVQRACVCTVYMYIVMIITRIIDNIKKDR